MSDLSKQTNEEKPLRTNPKFINEFGIVCFSISFSALVGAIVLAYIFRDDLGNATDKGPLWLVALPQILAIVGGSFAGFIWSRSWIQKQEINDQKALELANQKLTLEDRQKEFEHQKLESEKNRNIADAQFNARLLADQHQFQSNKFEERFNRILDDFAHDDPATRAGAASRFVSIAQVLDPGLSEDAHLTEKNNPYYMPAVRQLSQRLAMEGNKQVCKAIQGALSELSQWTTIQIDMRSEKDRSSFEEMQAKLVAEIAEVNRAAFGEWLETLAYYIAAELDSEQKRLISISANVGDSIERVIAVKFFSSSSKVPQGCDWCSNEALDKENFIRVFIRHERFLKAFRDSCDSSRLLDITGYSRSTQALFFARNALAAVLCTLPRAQENASGEIIENFVLGSAKSWLAFCFLTGADLQSSNLHNVSFFKSNLQGVDLFQTDLRKARLFDSDLSGAYLGYANLKGAYLQRARFVGADLRLANIEDILAHQTNFENADFSGAMVSEASLEAAVALHHSVLKAEFRRKEFEPKNNQWIVPERELNDKEFDQYAAIKRLLVEQKQIENDHEGPHDRPEPKERVGTV